MGRCLWGPPVSYREAPTYPPAQDRRRPKTSSPVEHAVEAAERRFGRQPGSVALIAAIESARGILSAREIATASPRLVAIAIGAEDFVTDLHTTRSADGIELLAARSMLVMAARAAGIMAIDTVFTGVDDEEGFLREARLAKQLGFDGKSVIHPSQIVFAHRVYTPTDGRCQRPGASSRQPPTPRQRARASYRSTAR